MPPTSRFKVAICGAGIAGLTTAVALSKYPDIEVEIFEAAEKLAEIGAGIGLFSRPWEVIKKLDLDEDLLRTTAIKRTEGPVASIRYRRGDRPEGIEFHTLVTNGNLMTFHRADFQTVLLRKLPPAYRIHCSKRLRSYSQRQGGGLTLLFEDGTRSTCDVLLGADGVKSAVRKSMLGAMAEKATSEGRRVQAADMMDAIEPSWSGTNAYRTLIPADRLRQRQPDHHALHHPTQYVGKDGYIFAYPISQGKMVNFVAFKSQHDLEGTKYNSAWVSPTDKAEFQAMFRHWEPEVQSLLDCVERPLRWAIHTVKPLGSFTYGNVAVMGDAAHAMGPHQGAGAGQGIEDAFILGLVLGHPKTRRETLSKALSIYDRIRRPFAQHVHELSRLNGRYFTLNCAEVDFDLVPEREMEQNLRSMAKSFTQNWEWAWTTSLGSSVQEALRLMEAS